MPKFTAVLNDNEPNTRRIALIVLLFLIAASQPMVPVDDPDIGWRLRTGEWMIVNRSVPFVDVFSYSMGKTWIAYSWFFDLLVYLPYALFGLSGIVYFVVAMALLITFAARQLVRRTGLPFAAQIVLVALAVLAVRSLMTPPRSVRSGDLMCQAQPWIECFRLPGRRKLSRAVHSSRCGP
jgi:hypothetical protein